MVHTDPEGRTRTRHNDSPLFVIAAKSVLRGLGTTASTGSLGSGSGGTLESCRAAEVGKYMTPQSLEDVAERRKGERPMTGGESL